MYLHSKKLKYFIWNLLIAQYLDFLIKIDVAVRKLAWVTNKKLLLPSSLNIFKILMMGKSRHIFEHQIINDQ